MSSWLYVYFVASIAMSALWATHVGRLLVLGSVVLLALLNPLLAERDLRPARKIPRISPRNLGVGLAVCAPVGVLLAMTWQQEFPFIGDHDYHLNVMSIAYDFWKYSFQRWIVHQRWIVLGIVLLGLVALRRSRFFVLVAVGALLLLLFFGYYGPVEASFQIRYPGTLYFLALPWFELARLFQWDQPLNVLRLTNVLSIPAWLFWLRPWIIGRWPGPSVLLFGLFFFYQKDFVYYFTSAYLEPWAAILVLVAAEHLLVFKGRDAWVSYLLIGFASMIKEQSIFVLPFVLASTFPFRGTRRKKLHAIVAALIACWPFVIYSIVRMHYQARVPALAPLADILNLHQMHVFLERMQLQFGPALPVYLAIVIAGVVLAVRSPRRRLTVAAVIGAGLFQVLFFYCDLRSREWIGYPRFQLLATLLLSAPLLVIGDVLLQRHWRRIYWGVCTLILVLNAATLVPFFVMRSQSDFKANFFEHYDAAVYLPVQHLIDAAAAQGVLVGKQKLYVLDVLGEIATHGDGTRWAPVYLRQAYPRLAERFEIELGLDAEKSELCRCTSSTNVNLATFVYYANISEQHASRPHVEASAQACLTTMKASCRNVIPWSESGQLIGILGTDPLQDDP